MLRALIDSLNRAFARAATGKNVLIVLAAAAVVFSLFGSWLVPAFQAATDGMYPIDMSFPATPGVMYGEFAHYTAESRRIYRSFFVVDFVWPPLLATLFAIGWTWLAQRCTSTLPQRMIGGGLLLLPYTEALLDVLENVGFLIMIERLPTELTALAWVTGTVKHTKLVLYLLCWLVTLMFGGLAARARLT